jgi:hypothetical protein
MLEIKDYIIIICIVIVLILVITPFVKKIFLSKDDTDTSSIPRKKEYYHYRQPTTNKENVIDPMLTKKYVSKTEDITKISNEIEKVITEQNPPSTSTVNLTPEFVNKNSVQQGMEFIEGKLYQTDSSKGENLRQFIENQDEFENVYNRIAEPMEVFQTVEQNIPDLPSQDQIRKSFNECMKSGTNTLEHCLTASSSILYPGLTKDLCSQYYGVGSPYCTRVEIRQINQQNTSARFGPA